MSDCPKTSTGHCWHDHFKGYYGNATRTCCYCGETQEHVERPHGPNAPENSEPSDKKMWVGADQ